MFYLSFLFTFSQYLNEFVCEKLLLRNGKISFDEKKGKLPLNFLVLIAYGTVFLVTKKNLYSFFHYIVLYTINKIYMEDPNHTYFMQWADYMN